MNKPQSGLGRLSNMMTDKIQDLKHIYEYLQGNGYLLIIVLIIVITIVITIIILAK